MATCDKVVTVTVTVTVTRVSRSHPISIDKPSNWTRGWYYDMRANRPTTHYVVTWHHDLTCHFFTRTVESSPNHYLIRLDLLIWYVTWHTYVFFQIVKCLLKCQCLGACYLFILFFSLMMKWFILIHSDSMIVWKCGGVISTSTPTPFNYSMNKWINEWMNWIMKMNQNIIELNQLSMNYEWMNQLNHWINQWMNQ